MHTSTHLQIHVTAFARAKSYKREMNEGLRHSELGEITSSWGDQGTLMETVTFELSPDVCVELSNAIFV